jgi:prepilin-type N-terminal cleavage/methylation domain-containing protein/prepilin-type processing-associated H-X9-DG protein
MIPPIKRISAPTGFTLIEMLVTISVMGVMSTIFFSGVQMVRDRAKIQHCQNNLRELGMAFNMYDTYWSGKFPPVENISQDDLRPLYPLCAKSLDLFICISTGNSVDKHEDLKDNAVGGRTGATGHSYDYHSYLLFAQAGHQLAEPVLKTRSMADLKGDIAWLLSDSIESGRSRLPDIRDNHYEVGGNVLFADSHVEWIDMGHWRDTFKAGNSMSY